MIQPDPWNQTLRRKEKADEDRYFAEQDRKLIEKRQRQPAQTTRPHHETAADVRRVKRLSNRRICRRRGVLSSLAEIEVKGGQG
jgi:hypothetical protein